MRMLADTMVLTIIVITVIFIGCLVVALKARDSYPAFSDEQLLNQHMRFLDELDRSRKYVGATYFHQKEKGSPAQRELTLRGIDVELAIRERHFSKRQNRPMDWDACRLAPPVATITKSAQ
jgi:hypothetical protein